MNNKLVLFIEDGDIKAQVERLGTVLRKQGITLIETIFNIGDAKFRMANPANTQESILNFSLIKETLRGNYMNQRFDYVLCDFDFKDKNLDGFKLIRWLKNVSENEKLKIRRAKFSLYSSEQDKFLQKILNEDEISNLIKLKLDDFYSRTTIAEDFGSDVVKSSSEINLKDKLISELDKYKELRFQSVYPKFKNKTLDEIAEEIEMDTYHGISFQEAIIELTVANLIEINNLNE